MEIFDELKIDLTKPTSIFGLPLWVLLGFIIGAITFLIIFLLCCFIYCYCCRPHRPRRTQNSRVIPHDRPLFRNPTFVSSKDSSLIHKTLDSTLSNRGVFPPPPPPPPSASDIQIDVDEDEDDDDEGTEQHYQMVSSSRRSSSYSNTEYRRSTAEVEHLGWGHWFTKKELEKATNGFSDNNVIGKGVYGTVYEGVLVDNMKVVVKSLLDNRDQAEKDFRVEVEAIGRIRHKNLVRLLGYCIEGSHRMLVYEYVDNGNLRQWLHGNLLEESLLTWDIRMNIILGTAKALAYLHEGLEPKVVHRDIKSCNILLDQQWNPKISDFGLAKLLCSDRSYITTRVMGTYGYLAPEYACTGMLNEKSDVYSFGVLVMEIVSGRRPVDNTQPPEEENLVEWLKNKVAGRIFDQILDPKLPEIPSSKALKRVLLVAIRCVDPDAQKRPKMGQVLNLLERDDLLFCDELRIGREASRSRRDYPQTNQVVSRLSVEKSRQRGL